MKPKSKPTGPELWPIEPEHDRFAVAVNGRVTYSGSEAECIRRLHLLTLPGEDRDRQDAFLRRACGAVIVAVLFFSWGALAEDLPILPDDTLTPGVVASTDEAEVCATGPKGTYSQQHRQTSPAMKAEVFRRYGIEKKGREFEIDHRLPLALGGKDDVLNLWPQQGWQHPSFHDKDRIEVELWRRVCHAGSMPLSEAQKMLLGDWIEGYEKVFGQPPR